jgi:hypothetical protein
VGGSIVRELQRANETNEPHGKMFRVAAAPPVDHGAIERRSKKEKPG